MGAKADVLVNLIPDTRKLDRALKGVKVGVGNGKGAEEEKEQTKNSNLMVGLTKKVLGTVASIAAILTALDFIIKPLFSLLTAILTLLFLPLLPIMKPTLMALAKFIPILAKASKAATKFFQTLVDRVKDGLADIVAWVTKLYDIFKGFVKGIATLGLWVWTEIIKPGFEFLLDVGSRIWTEIIKPGFDFVKTALRKAANAIIDLINNLPWIDISPIGGTTPVTPPSPVFPPPPYVPPWQSQTSTPTININNPIVREKSDIKKIADAVSKVLAGGVLRGGILSVS